MLINSSPWIFSSYDFIEVTEDNGTPNVLTEMEIENKWGTNPKITSPLPNGRPSLWVLEYGVCLLVLQLV